MPLRVQHREPREAVTPADNETEVNGTQRVQMKGVLPWSVPEACRAGTRIFCSALVALVCPEQNIFSSPYTVFQFLCANRPARRDDSGAGSPGS
jgi:hypothetical protein